MRGVDRPSEIERTLGGFADTNRERRTGATASRPDGAGDYTGSAIAMASAAVLE